MGRTVLLSQGEVASSHYGFAELWPYTRQTDISTTIQQPRDGARERFLNYRTGPGPHRMVADAELRPIFYLTPQSGRSFMIEVTTTPPPGSATPIVTQLLRAMLYVAVDTRPQRAALEHDIAAKLGERNDIAIRAKLLSLCRQASEKPWAYPALLDTQTCRRMYAELKPYVDTSDKVANFGSDPVSSIPIGAVLTKLITAAGAFGFGLATYFGGKSKDYYDFYAKRIAMELALRGIPESTL